LFQNKIAHILQKNEIMSYHIKIILFSFCLFTISNSLTAQGFKFKKKIGKYVFKPKKGKLNYDLQFDEVEFYLYGVWKVRNGKL